MKTPGAVGFASAAPAFAADLPTKKPAPAPIPEPVLPSSWHFELTGYLWATSLVGNTGSRRRKANSSFLVRAVARSPVASQPERKT